MNHAPLLPDANFSRMALMRASLRTHPSDLSTDAQFIVMLEAFRPHGGLARWGEFEAIVLRHAGNDPVSAATWLRGNRVFSFDWGGQTWTPLFQLSAASETLVIRADVARIVDVLRSSHDGWRTASWFVRRNTALGGATPLTRLTEDPDAVLAAARRAIVQRLN